LFRTLEEAIKRANATPYGLAAGVITKDIDIANRLSRSIKAGTVWINCYHVFDFAMPFGGYRMSGFGREHGIHSILSFMQVKSVITPLHDSPWL
jgi:coniferyl-aldehyde dehydrogenase